MMHFIGHVGRRETEYFIRKYVFPGGWIPSLADMIVAMEQAGLEVVDIENLRRHYALTLDVWAERFDRNWERIHALDPAALRRALPPHLARLSAGLRRDVPLAGGAHPPVPDRVHQGQHLAHELPDEPAFLYRSAHVERRTGGRRPTRTRLRARRDALAERVRAQPAAASRSRKDTSNLFRDRAARARRRSTCAHSITCSASTRTPAGSRPRA